MTNITDGAGKSRHTFIVSINIILEEENKILLLRRANTSWMEGFYNLPAGHVEEGETPTQCAIRELKEELDIVVSEKDLRYTKTLFRTGKNDDTARVDVVFAVKNWKGEANNKETSFDELRWVSRNELPEKTVPLVKTILNEETIYQELE